MGKNDYENFIFSEVTDKLFEFYYDEETMRVNYIKPRYDNQYKKYESESEMN